MNTFPHCFCMGFSTIGFRDALTSSHIHTDTDRGRKSLSYHAHAAAGSGVVPARRFFSFLRKISGFQQMNRSNFNGGEGSRGGLTHTYRCTCNFQDDHRMRADRSTYITYMHPPTCITYRHLVETPAKSAKRGEEKRKEKNLFFLCKCRTPATVESFSLVLRGWVRWTV